MSLETTSIWKSLWELQKVVSELRNDLDRLRAEVKLLREERGEK